MVIYDATPTVDSLSPGPTPSTEPSGATSSTTTRASSPIRHVRREGDSADDELPQGSKGEDRETDTNERNQRGLRRTLAECTVMQTSASTEPTALLPIVNAPVLDYMGHTHYLPTLLDTGSTASFITVSAKYMLRTPIVEPVVSLNIKHLGGGECINTCKVKVLLIGRDIEKLEIMAYVVPKITSPLPTYMAAPHPFVERSRHNARPDANVQLLLGYRDTLKVVDKVVPNGEKQELSTCWGFLGCGNNECADPDEETCNVAYLEELNHALEKFCRVEEYPADQVRGVTEDEARAIDTIEQALEFDVESGRFRTALLFREKPQLINNYRNAAARLDSLMRKLRREPDLCLAYKQAIAEYVELGAVERIEDRFAGVEKRRDVYYLPHRAVYDPTMRRRSRRRSWTSQSRPVAPT